MAETAQAGVGTPKTDPGSEDQGTVQKAKEQAQQAAGQAREQARGRLREQVDRRSTTTGEQISSQASDVRSVGDELRKQGKDGPAKVADQVADRAERVGSYLQRSDADRILDDVEDFARRNPWAVVAGSVAVGFAASRFLKASSRERYETRYRTRSEQLPATAYSRTEASRFERPDPGVTAGDL
jgi:ElaB/YqjD/DUF883 family membrane-anchored ribosome-binding protein